MKKLIAYRNSRKLSLRQMAIELGISYVSLWEYENGKKRPGRETAIDLAKKTGLSRDYLIFGDDDQAAA